MLPGLAGLFFVLAGCVSSGYNRDLTMAIIWQQRSGEYPALCYQAFNAGKEYIAGLTVAGPKAAILDIDETVLDNSRYAAYMVSAEKPWSAGDWEAWCKAAQAPAVPGSLDFANFLMSRSIEVYYVSNRPASATDATIQNLAELGFPNADTEHVLLQTDTSDKAPRLGQVRSAGYEIVLLAGDSLEDFESFTRRWSNEQRREWVDAQKDKFGVYWVVLPNSVYGTFESAIREGYYGLSLKEKAAARFETLDAWEPSTEPGAE